MADSTESARFDAAVRAEVQRIVAQQQTQFAQAMEQAMRASVGGLDAANAALEADRRSLHEALDAAKEARAEAERSAGALAEAAMERSRNELVEATERGVLTRLVRAHLAAGRSEPDICQWLMLEPEQLEALHGPVRVPVRGSSTQELEPRTAATQSARLTYESQGRGGTIWFENDVARFDMWWEFALSPALLFIDVPTSAQWEARTKLPVEVRDEVLRFIARQVIQDQASSSSGYELDANSITILR